jgi:hypothetical protein
MFRSRPFGRSLPQGLRSYPLGSHAPKPPSCIAASITHRPLPVSRYIATSSIHRFTFRLTSPTPIPSDDRLVLEDLKRLKHDKWGYVVYRCTYKDDAAWDAFKRTIHEQTQEDFKDSDTPELAEYLEWTFVEDRATLDGASIPQLRERFNQWAAKAVVAENPRAQQNQNHDRPTAVSGRYSCFIHVDEAALQSMMAGPERISYGEPTYVNFVDALWDPMGDQYHDGHCYDPDDELNEVLDPIDGCVEENVGWMRVEVGLAFSAYLYMGTGDSVHWYLYYRRPPGVLWQ